MKKGLFIVTALAMALGVGAAVGAHQGKAEVKSAEADEPSSFTNVYRFSVPKDFGSDVGNHIYLHAWGSSGGDTTWGNFITLSDYSYNENSERMYTYATDYTYTGFIIIRYSDNPDYCKTADISVGSDTAWSWDGANGASASAWNPVNQTYYLYDYRNLFGGEAKCYAWQSNGSLNNGSYPGVAMTKVQYGSGQLYSISLDSAFDEFKVGIGDSSNTGDVWINEHRGECYCFWESKPGWSKDLDWVKAHDWANNTMHIRDIPTSNNNDTGACKGSSGYYQKAKTAYNSFSAEVKAKFVDVSEYSDAQARFVAWAKANGESASFSGTTLTIKAVGVFGYETSIEEDSSILVIVFAAISVMAFTALLIVKKRKHN